MRRTLLAVLLVLAVFAGARGAAAEVRIETERLEIIAPDGMGGLAERIRAQLPVHLEDVERALGGRFHRRLLVRVARGDADFARQTARPAAQVAAVARPARGEIVLKASAIRPSAGETLPSIVRHELVHVVLYDLVGGRFVPRWFDEGLAELIGGRHPFGAAYELARGIVSDSIMPLADLTERFPDAPDAFALAYRQSESFVRHLRSQIGMDGLRRVIVRVREGATTADAIESESGRPLADHEATWRRSLEGRRGSAVYTLLAAWWWEILIALIAFGTALGVLRYRVLRRRILEGFDADDDDDDDEDDEEAA